MTFSVVIPVYNGEKYIRECIESALHQGDEDFYEIILAENNSSDATPGICDEYAANYSNVTALHLGAVGLYKARQEGIRASRGEWIVALDSDDRLIPMMLQELDSYIRSLKANGGEPELVFYNAAAMEDQDKPIFVLPFEENRIYSGQDKDGFKELICLGDRVNAMWIKCINRNIAQLDIDKNGLNYGEDLFATAHYINSAKGVSYYNKVLYLYRRHTESLTASYSPKFLDNQKFVWGQIDELSGEWFGDRYKDVISARKSLTCAILMSTIIYSEMSLPEKMRKVKILTKDSFYQKYYKLELPEWAPEEDVFVHGLMVSDKPLMNLLQDSAKVSVKSKIKRMLNK